MPQIRCLLCAQLLDSRLATRGRHRGCHLALKAERSRHMRMLGPCPQDGFCHHCGTFATRANPFVWDHFPKRFVDTVKLVNGQLIVEDPKVVVSCKRCNEGVRKRSR